MRYALIEANAVVETRKMASNFNPDEVRHKFDWRIVNLQTDPAFDPKTHKLQGFSYVVNRADVEAIKVVVPLTQAELDALTEQADRKTVRALYNALKNGVGTNAVRMARIEKVVARLLRDAYQ